MHNAEKHVFLVWRPKHASLCTKYATDRPFLYSVRVCLKRTMPKNVFWRGAPNTHASAPSMQPTMFFGHLIWVRLKRTIPKECTFLAWRPNGTYLCTKHDASSTFWIPSMGVPKNCLLGVPPQTRIPLHQICPQQGAVLVFGLFHYSPVNA